MRHRFWTILLAFAMHLPAAEPASPPEAGMIWDDSRQSWRTPSDYYGSRGYIRFQGRWMSKHQQRQLQRRQEQLREISRQRADWEQAWSLPTSTFDITSNCPATVVNEIAIAAEACFDKLSDVFRIRRLDTRIPIEVYATQTQFQQASQEQFGHRPGAGMLGYFWWRGYTGGIRMFYPGDIDRTLGVLYHELTHLIFRSAAQSRELPTWMNEGLAVLMEDAKRGRRGLETQAIPFDRLWHLKRQLQDGPVSLDALVRINDSSNYRVEHYPQGWAMTYFLLNGGNRVLKQRYSAMIMDLIKNSVRSDNLTHFQEHFGCRPDDLHEHWQRFVQELEPGNAAEFAAAATAACSMPVDFERALAYAASARSADGRDADVLTANALVHLRHALWSDDPEQRRARANTAMNDYTSYSEHSEGRLRAGKGRSLLPKTVHWARLAWAASLAGEEARAMAAIDAVLAVDGAAADGYRALAYVQVRSEHPEYHSLEAARENLAIARDLGPHHQNDYLQALLLVVETGEGWQDPQVRRQHAEALTALLQRAAEADRFGFGGAFYQREAKRLLAGGRP